MKKNHFTRINSADGDAAGAGRVLQAKRGCFSREERHRTV